MPRHTPALLALGALLPGCVIVLGGGPDDPPPVPGDPPENDCAEYAAASVLVSVVDPQGAPVRADAVIYSVPWSDEPLDAECADPDCTQWIAGWEIEGEITVEAILDHTDDGGVCQIQDSESATLSVPMSDDGCHVTTQYLTLTLDPQRMDCETGAGGE